MSTHYESVQPESLYPEAFQVPAPEAPQTPHAPHAPVGPEVWPRKPGFFIRLAAGKVLAGGNTSEAEGALEASLMAPPVRELLAGQLGLVPRWVKSASDAKLRSTKLVNARSETVTTSSNFRDAWLAGQRCIVPMKSFLEDDWRSGKAVPTRITRVDGKPMGVAGLWECWTGAQGDIIVSYTLLTVNANSHALLHRYQQPGNEKRMLAVLNEGAYDAWLSARPEKAKEFMRAYPANLLTANPIERKR